MAEEIAFEYGQISIFEGLVTLTLDQVILHTVVHDSTTSTYAPNFIEIEETLWTLGCTHVRTYGWTSETGFIRLTVQKSLPKNEKQKLIKLIN